MAALLDELDGIKEQKKAAAATFAAEEKRISADLRDAARTYRTGTELREIHCEITYDFAKCRVGVIRLDTKDVIESREMTDDEKQMELDFEGGQ
jgi:hypothetical protein